MRWFYNLSNRLHSVADSLFYRLAGGDRRPVFFDIAETMPALLEIDRNYEVILEELQAVMPRGDEIPEYHELDRKQVDIATEGKAAWRTLFVDLWYAGPQFPNRRNYFPRTGEILDRIPLRLGGFFSILEPGKRVTPHNGPAFWYLRYHIAMVVPSKRPPTLRVKDQYYTWRTGESILFDDSWNHEVANESDEHRVVLCVDVMRPEFLRFAPLGRLLRWMRRPPRASWSDVWEHLSLRTSA